MLRNQTDRYATRARLLAKPFFARISAGETALDGTVTVIQRPRTPSRIRAIPSFNVKSTDACWVVQTAFCGADELRAAGVWQSTQLRGFHEAPIFCA
jgi:hypothetical protein